VVDTEDANEEELAADEVVLVRIEKMSREIKTMNTNIIAALLDIETRFRAAEVTVTAAVEVCSAEAVAEGGGGVYWLAWNRDRKKELPWGFYLIRRDEKGDSLEKKTLMSGSRELRALAIMKLPLLFGELCGRMEEMVSDMREAIEVLQSVGIDVPPAGTAMAGSTSEEA
jgi:hypothetical protein